jgi:hypothetical protein
MTKIGEIALLKRIEQKKEHAISVTQQQLADAEKKLAYQRRRLVEVRDEISALEDEALSELEQRRKRRQ